MFATVVMTVGTLASTVVFAIDGKTDGTGERIAAIGAKTAATNGTEEAISYQPSAAYLFFLTIAFFGFDACWPGCFERGSFAATSS